MTYFTIDTQAIASMDQGFGKQFLLHLIYHNGHHVCLDQAGVILRQYSTILEKLPFFWRWWDTMSKAYQVTYYSGEVPREQRRHLLEALSFDKDDVAFVGVALSAQGLLVAEESDYTLQVREYLATLGVDCVNCTDAVGYCGTFCPIVADNQEEQ